MIISMTQVLFPGQIFVIIQACPMRQIRPLMIRLISISLAIFLAVVLAAQCGIHSSNSARTVVRISRRFSGEATNRANRRLNLSGGNCQPSGNGSPGPEKAYRIKPSVRSTARYAAKRCTSRVACVCAGAQVRYVLSRSACGFGRVHTLGVCTPSGSGFASNNFLYTSDCTRLFMRSCQTWKKLEGNLF